MVFVYPHDWPGLLTAGSIKARCEKNWTVQEETARLHLWSRHVDNVDDDDDQRCVGKTNSILQLFQLTRQVRAAPECNTIIQP